MLGWVQWVKCMRSRSASVPAPPNAAGRQAFAGCRRWGQQGEILDAVRAEAQLPPGASWIDRPVSVVGAFYQGSCCRFVHLFIGCFRRSDLPLTHVLILCSSIAETCSFWTQVHSRPHGCFRPGGCISSMCWNQCFV